MLILETNIIFVLNTCAYFMLPLAAGVSLHVLFRYSFYCKNFLVVLFPFTLHAFKNCFIWAEYVCIG